EPEVRADQDPRHDVPDDHAEPEPGGEGRAHERDQHDHADLEHQGRRLGHAQGPPDASARADAIKKPTAFPIPGRRIPRDRTNSCCPARRVRLDKGPAGELAPVMEFPAMEAGVPTEPFYSVRG